MANKSKQITATKPAGETWRKPLAVPPRPNAMRSFYQSPEEPAIPKKQESIETPAREVKQPLTEKAKADENPPKKSIKELLTPEAPVKPAPELKSEPAEIKSDASIKLTERELAEYLGLEIEDLFDIHEILRGKSFDIYLTLLKSSDSKGRCKITQPELMKLTGIKNRRTFYKHEGWLIDLKLIEKRHLQGDHQGVVYKAFQLSEALPVPGEMIDQFEESLKDFKPGTSAV